MEDIVLRKVWIWIWLQKLLIGTQTVWNGLIDRNLQILYQWPTVYCWSLISVKYLWMLLLKWKGCIARGLEALLHSDSSVLFIMLWSFFLCSTSVSNLLYPYLLLGLAAASVHVLGCTPRLLIFGIFGITLFWISGNFQMAGRLFIVGVYLFSLRRARALIFVSTTYALYCVKVHCGWMGIILSINSYFLSNDLLNYLLEGYGSICEKQQVEEQKKSNSIYEEFYRYCEFSSPANEYENNSCNFSGNPCDVATPKSTQNTSSSERVVQDDSCLVMEEMVRILNSLDHYETLGISRSADVDVICLRKEYKKKAILVHPDKNMGSPLASESFKKLQCAYEVLSDFTKRRMYDEQLLQEECENMGQMTNMASEQNSMSRRAEESMHVRCINCGNSHVWILTSRSKANGRWCQNCCQYHQVKDGEGWIEYRCSQGFKMAMRRTFVCAENKIFEVSEWAICQGISSRPNTHRPSFHVKVVGFEKKTNQKSEMTEYCDPEFNAWLQQTLSSGIFSNTSKRRMSWSPFNLHQRNISRKQWRRFS